ncbi:SAM-dependent methyltransferase [Marilutibacter aestuarii]|uniref:Class I SAM-dependent methyltransferase n=1 Tax=Marilutibacter aestuarii TaxID=1706195 RepID=A0A508A6M3_9GAMM|nr:cyclopropane-fatty-acyl-phospholipid synthase family protein [Lysobacter aestuarii]TQD45566.1 class I SAM-dependent methyltransferase [Lysobacter aestuarii]
MTEAVTRIDDPARYSTLDRFLRERLLAMFATLDHGGLTLVDGLGTSRFGGAAPDGLEATVRINDPAFYRAVAARGSVGAGEAYIEGHWECSDLVALVRLLVRNRDLLDGMEGGLARLGGWMLRAWHALQRNTREGSRRNITAHYDLGNEFFGLFLSPDLMYSSALFESGDEPLEAASRRKLEAICAHLELRPGDRVVEIGTGWGGFALHAARHHGCHVTTTTISREQHALASERVAAAGLQDRVTLLLDDYRDLQGSYDKLVSIEMIEAVGADYLDTYFATLGRLLAPGGRAVLQAITIEDHRYAQARDSVDFIKRFVFPGSFIPSISAMLDAKARNTDLQLLRMEDFGPSYALTLRAWRQRFLARLPEVRAQGFDERFIRMWTFYLAYCEGGFLERATGVAHLVMGRPDRRGMVVGAAA